MIEILNTSFFDPIAPYIREVRPTKNYLKIELPAGLVVDEKEILKYYKEDVAVHYTRGDLRTITGTLKESVLFNYLLAKYYSTGPKFNT